MLNYITGATLLQTIAVLIAGFLALCLALGFHEASHAFMANKAGDLTPKAYGRLTLNPFKHFDVYGTLMLLLLGFGWAKPVPINPANFKKPRRDFFLVAIAGISANLILAFLATPLLLLVQKFLNLSNFGYMLIYNFLLLFVVYNVNFAVFNLLPIYPLDGFNVVVACSKTENGYIRFMKQYGFIVLIVIVLIFSFVISYPVNCILCGFEWFWGLLI